MACMDSSTQALRARHQAARQASFQAGTSLADAVRRRARWTRLDGLVREVVRCHQEEDRLFDRLLFDDDPMTGGWTLAQ